MNYQGYLIARERRRKSWSQEGLCRGICAVSYLSKIESGKAEPSGQVLCMLLDRLGLQYNASMETEAAQLAEEGFELLVSGRFSELQAFLGKHELSRFQTASTAPELAILNAVQITHKPLDPALEPFMEIRSLALQRTLQGRDEEAVQLWPNAYTHMMLGIAAYETGHYSTAIDALQSSYDLAAREGAARIMLLCELFLGNSYCNLLELSNMERHYRIARRLAEDLKEPQTIKTIDYNRASAWLETGRYEDAYAWFSSLKEPTLMSLHKLAICCEKTGRQKEGLAALDQTAAMETDELELGLAKQLCALVRYRLEHPDYLEHENYGTLLLDCFSRCQSELPSGYASFHLPWVLEWYKATRQYKKACELLESFPGKLY